MSVKGPIRRVWPEGWFARLAASPRFQDWVSRTPGLSRLAARDGAQLFDVVQGFVRSQVLFAIVSLDIPERLMAGAARAEDLSIQAGIPANRLCLLLQAGAGIGILKRCRDDRFALSRRGAALCGVPGLRAMILHNGAFYRDMGNPVSLLRGDLRTEVATSWPYVLGETDSMQPRVVETYSELMAETQKLVAQDTLRTIDLHGVRRLMDVGGGTGAFLIELARARQDMELCLFDLPAVEAVARKRIQTAGLAGRIEIHPGSFHEDPLPRGADAISLVRVLYDHDDPTVTRLLYACFASLPPGGRLIISEPMSGGHRPDPITDVYFAFYTLAMRTGRTRSPEAIAGMVRDAGFDGIATPRPTRPYITSVLTAVRAG